MRQREEKRQKATSRKCEIGTIMKFDVVRSFGPLPGHLNQLHTNALHHRVFKLEAVVD